MARFVAPVWHLWSAPLRRYLAAKAFASWTAYQGHGLLTIVRGLDAAAGLVRVEAARDAATPATSSMRRACSQRFAQPTSR